VLFEELANETPSDPSYGSDRSAFGLLTPEEAVVSVILGVTALAPAATAGK
jgi:hypothetical protein